MKTYKFNELSDSRVYRPRKLKSNQAYFGQTYDVREGRFINLGDLATTSEYAGVRNLAGAVAKRARAVGGSAMRSTTGMVNRAKGIAGRAMGSRPVKAVKKRIAGAARAIAQSKVGQAIEAGIKKVRTGVRKGIGMAARTGVGRAIGRTATGVTRRIGGVSAAARVGRGFNRARRFSSGRRVTLLSDASDRGDRAEFLLGMGKKKAPGKKPSIMRRAAGAAMKVGGMGLRAARAVASVPGRATRMVGRAAIGAGRKVAGAAAVKGARRMLRLSGSSAPLSTRSRAIAEFKSRNSELNR